MDRRRRLGLRTSLVLDPTRQAVRDYIDSLKEERGGCERCPAYPSKWWGWESFDWDHVRGEKRFCVGSAVPYAYRHGNGLEAIKETVAAEIAKCQLLCANCHRTVTRKRSHEKHAEASRRWMQILEKYA